MPAHHTLGGGSIGRRQVLSDLLSRRPGCAGSGSGSARYSRGVRIGNWVEDEFPAGALETFIKAVSARSCEEVGFERLLASAMASKQAKVQDT